MDTTVLEDIGLTNAEVKVYLALLELGTCTAGPIIKKTGLQNSVVHMTLTKLSEKAFLSFIKKGKVKHYTAADPANIINFIEEKKNKFEAILPQLLARQNKVEKQEAEIYEGFKGFKNMQYEFLKDSKKGDEFLFFSFYTKNPKEFEFVFEFYREYDKVRQKKGLIVKGIFPKELEYSAKDRTIQTKVVDFPIPLNISILNDKVVMTPWEDKQISFLIHSRQLAEQFRTLFYSIWNT